MQSETQVQNQSSVDVSLTERFLSIRDHSRQIASLLYPEDCVIQSMPDASPIRWHLAHTTWFFETFVLKAFTDYVSPNDAFEYLFNSYYNTVGEQYPRERRGLISRPTVSEVNDYRAETDDAITAWIESGITPSQRDVLEIGLQHEQQHQELMLTDVKHLLSCNPLLPAMFEDSEDETSEESSLTEGVRQSWDDAAENRSPSEPLDENWVCIDEGLYEIGHPQGSEKDVFAYDNESPRHRVFLESFRIRAQLTSNAEFLKFIDDGGYERPEFWLSAGWATVQSEGWAHPLYWQKRNGQWHEFTLAGQRRLDMSQPVTHVSYFEADAFARWCSQGEGLGGSHVGQTIRLATESEWEVAADLQDVIGGSGIGDVVPSGAEAFFEKNRMVHPELAAATDGGWLGCVWQWTSSQYTAYPGYEAPPGALGEYNGKFMCNQFVLRGSSCATPRHHARLTYRNFFPPQARWQFAGIRLASG